MTAVKISHATTGCARTRVTRDWSSGRRNRRRWSWLATRSSERDRRPEGDERRGNQCQQDVLDHVDAEQRRVVARDPRLKRERDGHEPAEERNGPRRRDAIRRMGAVDPPDRPEIEHGRGEQRDRDQADRTTNRAGHRPRQAPRLPCRERPRSRARASALRGRRTGPARPDEKARERALDRAHAASSSHARPRPSREVAENSGNDGFARRGCEPLG